MGKQKTKSENKQTKPNFAKPESQALMFYYQRMIFPLAFQNPSTGHFAKAYGRWQPGM